MAIYGGTKSIRVAGKNIVNNGLVFCVDAADDNSYPGSGTTWTDLVSNTDTTMNGTTYTSDYMNFDGNDYVSGLPTPPAGNSTYGAWCYFDGGSSWKAVFNSASSTLYLWFGRGGSGQLFLHHHNTNNTSHSTYTANSLLSTSTWYYITSTWDGSACKLYLNGVLQSTTTAGTPANITSASGIWLGRYNNDYFGGRMGQIQIYNKALSAAEILYNYNILRGRFGL